MVAGRDATAYLANLDVARECAVCGLARFEVHHIDGNRANNLSCNLVPLCNEHHDHTLGQVKLLGVLLTATLRRALKPQDSREWGNKFRWVLWLAAAEKRIPEPCASKHPWDRACMRMLHGMTCSYRHLKATYGIPLPPEVAKIEAAAERARRGRYSEGERKGETAAPAERVWRKPEVLTEREAHPLFWLPGSCDMWTREEYEWMAKRYGGKREERTGKDWDESYEAYFQREDHKWRTMLNRIGI